jgi:hypothetical protein
MVQYAFAANRHTRDSLLALPVFQDLFLWIHDWIPLGRPNDIAAVRSQDTTRRLVLVTLIQSVPFTVGLVFSLLNFARHHHHWLYNWLWISYGLLFLGKIGAWWIPYLFRAEPKRAARYRVAFGSTYSFLPQRNRLVPNTAHILIHLSTAATLAILLIQ